MTTTNTNALDGDQGAAQEQDRRDGSSATHHQSSTFTQRALPLVQALIPVFPLGVNSKKPAITRDDGGKGFYDATTNRPTIARWGKQYPRANVGRPTGHGCIIIDRDTYKSHYAAAKVDAWKLPPTRTVRTAHGGYQDEYVYAGDLPSIPEDVLAGGVCIKATGGYVVAPGSVVDGGVYEVINPDQPIAELPEWFAEMIRAASRQSQGQSQDGASVRGASARLPSGGADDHHWLDHFTGKTYDGVGDRNGYLLAQQLLIANKNGSDCDVQGELLAYAERATVDTSNPFDEGDIERWIRSAEQSNLVARGEPARGAGKLKRTPAPSAATGTVEELEAMIHEDDEEGEQPLPVLGTVERFPVEVLPKPMRDLVQEGARAIHCPPDLIAVPMLAVTGAAIGTTHCIEVKRGYRQWPSIRGIAVARPGDRKSPANELACEPVKERQKELAAKFETEIAAYRAQEDPQGPEPVMEQIWTSDTTSEALVDVLNRNRRGITFIGDEISGWALAMNQYKGGQGADRKMWLSMHDCSSIVVNRRNRKGAAHVARPFVAVTGTIQPDVLSDLSDERGREDGFIHRILFSYPEPMRLEWTEATVSTVTRDAYHGLFKKLWDLQFDTDGVENLNEPQVLRFTDAGYRQWVAWVSDHYDQVNEPRFPDNLRGPWIKLEGYAARLALIIHVCRRACGETTSYHVDELSMAAAGDLIDYFKSHTRKVYAMLRATPEDKQVLTALAWIKRQPERKVSARDLQHAGVTGITTSEEAQNLLEQLKERGYGRVEVCKSKHGKPSFIFTLHPTSDNIASGQTGTAA